VNINIWKLKKVMNMKKAMKEWIEKFWGKRCKEFEENCPVCKAWLCFDYLFGEGKVNIKIKDE